MTGSPLRLLGPVPYLLLPPKREPPGMTGSPLLLLGPVPYLLLPPQREPPGMTGSPLPNREPPGMTGSPLRLLGPVPNLLLLLLLGPVPSTPREPPVTTQCSSGKAALHHVLPVQQRERCPAQ